MPSPGARTLRPDVLELLLADTSYFQRVGGSPSHHVNNQGSRISLNPRKLWASGRIVLELARPAFPVKVP